MYTALHKLIQGRRPNSEPYNSLVSHVVYAEWNSELAYVNRLNKRKSYLSLQNDETLLNYAGRSFNAEGDTPLRQLKT